MTHERCCWHEMVDGQRWCCWCDQEARLRERLLDAIDRGYRIEWESRAVVDDKEE